jgi:hypothetical protein
LYIGKNDDSGCATFSKIKSTKVSLVKSTSQKRGMSVGEFIFDVMSKDIESSNILDAILEDFND